MAGKTRPSLREKTLQNVAISNLSMTDKKCIESVFAKFDAMSKADGEEVKHGEWYLHPDGSGTCSNCNRTQKSVWDMDNQQNYCGNCGAKMDIKTT